MEPLSNPDKTSNNLPRFDIIFGAVLVILTSLILLNSRFFVVNKVEIQGNQAVPQEDIILKARLNSDRNIFQIDSAQIRNSILHDLRIASVKIKRQLPGKLIIIVRERTPICLLSYLNNLLIIGDDGLVMGIHDETEPVELPVVTGVRLGNVKYGEKVESAEFQAALEILRYADDYLHQIISEIDLERFRLYLDLSDYRHSVKVELGAAERLEEKITNLRAILLSPELNGVLEQIDLRVPDLPTVTTSRSLKK